MSFMTLEDLKRKTTTKTTVEKLLLDQNQNTALFIQDASPVWENYEAQSRNKFKNIRRRFWRKASNYQQGMNFAMKAFRIHKCCKIWNSPRYLTPCHRPSCIWKKTNFHNSAQFLFLQRVELGTVEIWFSEWSKCHRPPYCAKFNYDVIINFAKGAIMNGIIEQT